jgi:hypothetical protein
MGRRRRRRLSRRIRIALVLWGTVATTGLISFGGLASWQSYTDNPSSVAAESLGHANTSAGVSCTSVSSTTLLNQSGDTCSAVIAIANVSPDSPATLATGTVRIVNTGQLSSTFSLSMLTAPRGNLCADLQLTVTDLNSGAPDSGTVYPATTLSAQITSPITLYDNAATPSTTWTGGGTAPGGTGATGNTFTLSVTKGPSFNTDSADQGQSCSFDTLFTEQNV